MILILIAAAAVAALTPQTDTQQSVADYRGCLSKAQAAPSDAVLEAEAWAKRGGGVAALVVGLRAAATRGAALRGALASVVAAFLLAGPYYLGVAQTASRQPAEGARTLEAAAQAAAKPALTAELLAQAGNAWLLADRPAEARTALSRAIALAQAEPERLAEMLVDRARAAASTQDWPASIADLRSATRELPKRADIWLLLATAQRHTGDAAGAAGAVEQAFALDPDDPAIRLERGNARARAGDMPGARKDWQAAVENAARDPDSARLARQNLDGTGQ